FGTVLFGRMHGGEGSDRTVGLFINTLPMRMRMGEEGVGPAVRRGHAELAGFLRHGHAAPALGPRCSSGPAPVPLLTALMNYRHSAVKAPSGEALRAWDDIDRLRAEERTNYPITIAVDDLGEGLVLVAQTSGSVGPERVCGYMHTALGSMVEMLETAPDAAVRTLDLLPANERKQLLLDWNATSVAYDGPPCINGLFETQVEQRPESTALVLEDSSLSYEE